ncbi:MAG: Eco57I restriction-modification methylase domain-containing protein [Tagaea sp.]|nr:Eco57I restriction-modification methylase domain-containing protein [Tagaea sp.]
MRRVVDRLHEACAIYTRPDIADLILDIAGFKSSACRKMTLLEPSCGEGAILVQAAKRLLATLQRKDRAISTFDLLGRLRGYEISATAACVARRRLREVLVAYGLPSKSAAQIARDWVRSVDFLTDGPVEKFDVVVGNPPYVRWSNVPRTLRRLYERAIPSEFARGDLALAFLWRGLDRLREQGSLVYLTTDRWRTAKYAEGARAALPNLASLVAHVEIGAMAVYATDVNAYAAISWFRKDGNGPASFSTARPIDSLESLRSWATSESARPEGGRSARRSLSVEEAFVARAQSLPLIEDVGCRIRCGVATGAIDVFHVAEGTVDLEREVLLPLVRGAGIHANGEIRRTGLLINPWKNGELIDLWRYPKARRYLLANKARLLDRACVLDEREWYRTIDRIDPARFKPTKILCAGIAKHARLGVDRGGHVPDNSMYSIESSVWPVQALYAYLNAGVLDAFASVFSARLSGNARRYNGYLLRQVRLPHWGDLGEAARANLLGVKKTKNICFKYVSSLTFDLL